MKLARIVAFCKHFTSMVGKPYTTVAVLSMVNILDRYLNVMTASHFLTDESDPIEETELEYLTKMRSSSGDF